MRVIIALAIIVVSSLLPGQVEAAGDLGLLVRLGIVSGYEDGSYHPQLPLTRAEFAALSVRMRGLDAVARSAHGYIKLDDVPPEHWASGYVAVAIDRGFMSVREPGRFEPSAPITGTEFAGGLAAIVGASSHWRQPHSLSLEHLAVSSRDEPVLRETALAACAHVLTLPLGPHLAGDGHRDLNLLTRTHGASEVQGLVTAVDAGDEPTVEILTGDERQVLAVAPELRLAGFSHQGLQGWTINETVVAVRPLPAVTGTLTAYADQVMVLGDDREEPVPGDALVLIDWRESEVADLDLIPPGSHVRIATIDGHTGIFVLRPIEPQVITGVGDTVIRLSDSKGYASTVDTRYVPIRTLGDDWGRGFAVGDVVYVKPHVVTTISDRITGTINETRAGLVIGSQTVRLDRAIALSASARFIHPLQDWSVGTLLGVTATAASDIDGAARSLIVSSELPAPGPLLLGEGGFGGHTEVYDSKGRQLITSLSSPEDARAWSLLALDDGGNLVRVPFSVTDEYLTVGNIDPQRLLVRDQERTWRVIDEAAPVFYVAGEPDPPFHRGGVTVLTGAMLRHYAFDDPAAGALMSLACYPHPGGPVIQAVVLRPSLVPPRLYTESMTAVVLSHTRLNGDPAITFLIDGMPVTLSTDQTAIHSRDGRQRGLPGSGADGLDRGEVVRLRFDLDSGQLLSVLELRARPLTEDAPRFVVEAYAPELRAITVRQRFGDQRRLTWLITTDTVVYDARSIPRIVTDLHDLAGNDILLLAGGDDGTVQLLVVVADEAGRTLP